MTDRAARRRAVVEQVLAEHLRVKGAAYLRDEDYDGDEFPAWLSRAEEQALPPSMLSLLAALHRRYDDNDCGGTRVVPMEDDAGRWWVIRTTSDGDEGYAFVFDAAGECQGAARTSLELCGWDSLEATRKLLDARAHADSIPESLRKRPSLWLEIMKAQQRRKT